MVYKHLLLLLSLRVPKLGDNRKFPLGNRRPAVAHGMPTIPRRGAPPDNWQLATDNCFQRASSRPAHWVRAAWRHNNYLLIVRDIAPGQASASARVTVACDKSRAWLGLDGLFSQKRQQALHQKLQRRVAGRFLVKLQRPLAGVVSLELDTGLGARAQQR